jgi:hypothetical protein
MELQFPREPGPMDTEVEPPVAERELAEIAEMVMLELEEH